MKHTATLNILDRSYPIMVFDFDKKELATKPTTMAIPNGQLMLGISGHSDTFLAEIMVNKLGVTGECRIVFEQENIENGIEEINFLRGTITDYEERIDRGDEFLSIGISVAASKITIKRRTS